ncbi:hypothetical protein Taro_023379 [Colocasia esculenta]|uniref:Protein PRD1 n=1 Tax=Colocasia esculenta TaxID=4460 RepID=A0A843V410_COLES|nr:hypothetical protein [Colocasia esculenta]
MAGRRRWTMAAAGEEEEGSGEGCYSDGYCREEGDGAVEEEPRACGKGHRASLLLATAEGGGICLVCFSNLVSDPAAPSHHVSYALSQLSRAVRGGGGHFLRELRARHGHLLVLPLVQALSFASDEPIALQAIDLVSDLCSCTADLADLSSASSGGSMAREFIVRIADRLASGELAWSRRQVFMVGNLRFLLLQLAKAELLMICFLSMLVATQLHCFGILLGSPQAGDASAYIRDMATLVSNLITGLQLPSEEIRGEILFVLYKLSVLLDPPWVSDDDEEDESSMGVRLLRLSLEVLLKTQNDAVRTNCIALLTVLVLRGYFGNDQDDDNYGETNRILRTEAVPDAPLVNLFADAIKGPLLSSDTEVQIGTLELVYHYISLGASDAGRIGMLIEENIAEYVFEILRLSANKDLLVVPCVRVLDLLAVAEETFNQRLAVGFSTLLTVLHYVADIPLHPVQCQTMKLVWNCISNSPGVISISQVEMLAMTLTGMFGRYNSGELGMLSETFILACLTFVEVLKSPSSCQNRKLETFVKEASQSAILSSLSAQRHTSQPLLYSLYLLKEAFMYSRQEILPVFPGRKVIGDCIIEICATHLLPWLGIVLEGGEDEEAVLGVLETFHLIVLQESEAQTVKFAEVLASSNWVSWSFGFLGLFPSLKMKWRVYLMLSSVADCIFGQEFGEPIRNAYMYLPSDPIEMMFLLEQRSTSEENLISCQSAVLLILYISSLFDQRIADEHQVLASLEQYVLVNGGNFSCGIADSAMLTQLVHLYSFARGVLTAYKAPYSHEAEKTLFGLIYEHDWDLLSIGIHPTAFKWLLQQDSIRLALSSQILNFCGTYSTNRGQVSKHAKNIQIVDIQMVADLVASGDNYLASLLVCLLKQLQEDGQEEDAVLVMNVILAILNIFPDASKELYLNNITDTFRILFHYSSTKMFTIGSLLAFNVLNFVDPRMLSEDGSWLPITVKLLEWLSPHLAEDTCSTEVHLVVGILCLILHHSTSHALTEASKAILLNACLVSAVDHKIQAACAKGPALVNYNEETDMGEFLLLILLLHLFSLRSLHAVLQESVDWQSFMQPSDGTQVSQVMRIPCHDLCRLLHYGSHPIKLVASQCLLELLTKISEQRTKTHNNLTFSGVYLRSIMAVTMGLVFHGDSKVAMNCGLCSSMILGWGKLRSEENNMVKDFKWCRLVIEELTLYLAAPGLASRSFTNNHKPAAHIAVALLRSDEVPEWLGSVLDTRCISSIIKNLSVNNITPEMVELFRELASRGQMNKEQIAGLEKLFQVCRKNMYKDNCRGRKEEYSAQPITASDDTGKTSNLLIRLMLHSYRESIGIQSEDVRLLKEIDSFLQEGIKLR